MLKGIGASQGFGIGKAVVIKDINLDYSFVKFTDSEHQKKRLRSAVADFSDETKALANGGKMIPYTGGALWIRRGTPFAQHMADDDDTIRRIYLNLTAEYLSAE